MATAPSTDPIFLVEPTQKDLANLRRHVAEPGPLLLGERAAAAHHIQALASGLGFYNPPRRASQTEPHVRH
jgi:hypothetical protein